MRYSIAGVLVLGCVLADLSSVHADFRIDESIEWVIADSDRIVIGRVIKMEKVACPGHNEHRVVATIEIAKTLKGIHEPTVTFVLRDGSAHWLTQDWMKHRSPMMFCLVKKDRLLFHEVFPPEYEWGLRQPADVQAAISLGNSKKHLAGAMTVFTMDFDVLTEPNAIASYVEDYLNAIPANWKTKETSVKVPKNTRAHGEYPYADPFTFMGPGWPSFGSSPKSAASVFLWRSGGGWRCHRTVSLVAYRGFSSRLDCMCDNIPSDSHEKDGAHAKMT